MRPIEKFFISPRLICLFIGLLLLGASLIDYPGLLKLEYPFYDLWMTFRTTPGNKNVVLIADNRITGEKDNKDLEAKLKQLGGEDITFLTSSDKAASLAETALQISESLPEPQQLLLKLQNPLSPYRMNPPDKKFGDSLAPSTLRLLFPPDPDGKIRCHLLLLPHGNQLIPSLPLAVAVHSSGHRLQQLQLIPAKQVGKITTPELKIPTIGYYRMLLDSHSGDRPFDSYSAAAVQRGELSRDALKGKIVLVGPTASYGDWHQTAGYGEISTSELAALATATLLAGSAPQRPTWGWAVEAVVMLYFMMLVTFLLPRLSFRAGAATLIICLSSWILAAAATMIVSGLWLKIAPAALFCGSGFILMRWHIGSQEKFHHRQQTCRDQLQRFQEQGLLDLALEKGMAIDPGIEENRPILYNLALELERKRLPHAAISIYSQLLKRGKFRDTKKRLKFLEKHLQPANLTTARDGTIVLNRAGENPTLGRYKIERELGQGAMGTVYLGIDPKINRQVAIKTLDYSQLDPNELPQVKERFFREAEAAGKLSHPNIVTIYDVGEEADLAYLAMEFLTGKDLSCCCDKKTRLPAVQVIKIMTQVAAALDYAHKQGIVHRDIKPANIILQPEMQVKVSDFGIARIMTSSNTETGIILGTPSYMSPEQVAGKKVDGRSDLFSLGIVMYELLSGEKPFQGETLTALMYNISTANYTPLVKASPKLPDRCHSIVAKLLQKTLMRRYKSAAVLHQELLALQKHLETS